MSCLIEFDIANVACPVLRSVRLIAKEYTLAFGCCKARHGVRDNIDPKEKTFLLRSRTRWKDNFHTTIVAPVDAETLVAKFQQMGRGNQGVCEVRRGFGVQETLSCECTNWRTVYMPSGVFFSARRRRSTRSPSQVEVDCAFMSGDELWQRGARTRSDFDGCWI